MEIKTIVAVTGLALDIVGAYFIVQGFIVKDLKDIVKETRTTVGFNRVLAISFIRQKTEAQVGYFILVLGFLGQILSYFTPKGYIDLWLAFFLLSILICLVFAAGLAFLEHGLWVGT